MRIDAELELRALAAERPVAVADLKEAELELESPATTQTSEETRLATLMQATPIQSISDPQDRSESGQTRTWQTDRCCRPGTARSGTSTR